MRRTWFAAALAAAALFAASPGAGGQGFQKGSPGLGDPFFPKAGNGGYDVDHYSITFTYKPNRNFIVSRVVIDAHATEDLGRFDLDFRGFHIRRLKVDDQDVSFKRRGQELIVTPVTGIADGASFRVVVSYKGEPKLVQDPDESYEGWSATKDGAFVVGEPQGSPGWYPVNDYPTDKATFDFTVRVPKGLKAIANGELVQKSGNETKTTFVWNENVPMAPYLATVTTGKFKLTQDETHDGIRIVNAVAPRFAKDSRQVLHKQKRILDFFQSVYGTYPFEVAGAIIDKDKQIGYALETQTKPVYAFRPQASEVAHELAHQWLGDDVTLSSWPDIWLNEGFATWSQWLWAEHTGSETAQHAFKQSYKTPAKRHKFWNPPPGDPGKAENIFRTSIYVRGAMTLQALRHEIGKRKFTTLMRRWISEHHLGNASTADFTSLAEDVANEDLDHFFHVWLFRKGKPSGWSSRSAAPWARKRRREWDLLTAESPPARRGVAYRFKLPVQCGVDYATDFDGSFWRALHERAAIERGDYRKLGPISDRGTITLVASDRARYVSKRAGTVIRFSRIGRTKRVPSCY